MFRAEAELEKERARLEGAVVEAARVFAAKWRAFRELRADAATKHEAWIEVRAARQALFEAVDALERAYRGEYA